MKTKLPRLTDRLRVGDLKVSPFCVGMVTDTDTVKAAYDAGINFFFVTADMHWPYYDGVRLGLKKLFESGVSRDKVVIAGVSYATQPEFCTMPFTEIVESFPWIETLDVCVMGGTYALDFFGRLPVYVNNKKRRHCGSSAIGATFHERRASVSAVNYAIVDVAFIRYNPSHSGADLDVFPHLSPERSAPVFGFKSTYGKIVSPAQYESLGVSEENWRPDVSDFYRYALTSPLDGVLCSPTTPAHVKSLVEAMERGPLTEPECEYMRDLGDLMEGRAVVDSEDGEDAEDTDIEDTES